MGQCNFLHLWHQKLYRAFRFGTLWPISCSNPRHSQLTRHSLMLANGRMRQSLTALVNFDFAWVGADAKRPPLNTHIQYTIWNVEIKLTIPLIHIHWNPCYHTHTHTHTLLIWYCLTDFCSVQIVSIFRPPITLFCTQHTGRKSCLESKWIGPFYCISLLVKIIKK